MKIYLLIIIIVSNLMGFSQNLIPNFPRENVGMELIIGSAAYKSCHRSELMNNDEILEVEYVRVMQRQDCESTWDTTL